MACIMFEEIGKIKSKLFNNKLVFNARKFLFILKFFLPIFFVFFAKKTVTSFRAKAKKIASYKKIINGMQLTLQMS